MTSQKTKIAYSKEDNQISDSSFMVKNNLLVHAFKKSCSTSIAIVDETGKQVFVNDSFCKLTGWTEAELIGQYQPYVYWPVEELKLITEVFQQSEIENVAPKEFTSVFYHKTGKLIPVNIVMSCFTDNSKIYRFINVFDTSSQKSKEHAHRESEGRFIKLLNDVQCVSVQGYRPDGTTHYWNKASEQLYGYTAEEAIGKNLLDLIIPPESKEFVRQDIQQMAQSGQPIPSSELLLMRKDGSRVPVFSSHTIIQIPEQPQELYCIDIDLTELKKAEQIIKESEEQLKKISLISTDYAYSVKVNEDGSLENEWATGSFEKITGYNAKEIWEIGGIEVLIHPADLPKAIERVKEQLRGNTVTSELRVRTKSGDTRWISDKGVPQWDENEQRVVRILGVAHEITERKKTEEAIKESELRLRSLVRILQFNTEVISELLDFTLEEAIQLTNSKIGYIYFYNEKKQQFTLHSWSKGIMKECSIVEPQTIYNLEKTGIWGEAVRQRKPIIINDFQTSNPLKKGYPEGHANLFKYLTIPVIIDDVIVAVIGVANKESDYTENDILHLTLLMDSTWKTLQKKNIEEFVRKQNVELKKLNTDKDRFMSILAHDLRNPFNALLGLSELLTLNIRKYNIDKIEKQINIINNSAKRVFNLLEDISMWARTQSGKIPFEPQKINITDICKGIIDDAKLVSDTKNIRISLKCSGNIIVFADIDMLKTVLRNLITNAIKFTGIGGKISITMKMNNVSLAIMVSDTGIGISPEDKAKLFDISQKHSTYGTSGEIGTGLGLLICKEFIEKHGGKIWVDSEVGKGSVFSLNIPIINE